MNSHPTLKQTPEIERLKKGRSFVKSITSDKLRVENVGWKPHEPREGLTCLPSLGRLQSRQKHGKNMSLTFVYTVSIIGITTSGG